MTIVVLAALAALVLALALFTYLYAERIEAALPPSGKFFDIDGERLHYVDHGGTGPAIVMIHGLSGNLKHFEYALAPLLVGAFRVVLIDRPGSGYSSRADGGDASLAAQADAIATLIRALGLWRPILVGHSLGGAVALAVALDHPDCAGALALIAPLTHPVDTTPPVFRGLLIGSRTLRRIVAWTIAAPLGKLGERATLRQVFAPEAPAPDFGTRAGGLLSLRPSAFLGASADITAVAAALPAYVTRYPSLAVPLGVLYGRGDALLDPKAQGEAMKTALPATDLEIGEGGHMLPFTAPERCAAFVRRVAARSAG